MSSITLTPIPASSNAKDGGLQIKYSQVRSRSSSGNPVSGHSFTSESGKSVTYRIQSSGDSSMRLQIILPVCSVISTSVPVHRITQLGLTSYLGRQHLRPLQWHFHSVGLTYWFAPPRRSDQLVLGLLRQWQDLSFLTTGIPIRPFQADITIFLDASTQGWGAHMGDSQILGTWAPTGRRLYINCLELKVVMLLLHHEAPVLHGCQVMIATGNTMVVSYINKQGGTQLPLPATSSSRANPVASVPEHSHKGQTHCGLSQCDS